LVNTKQMQKCRQELIALAESLPFKIIELPEFKKTSYRPESIRQDRQYLRIEPGMQTISRFLLERGVVEILDQTQILEIFREIYWCVYQIRIFSRRRFKDEDAVRDTLVNARKLTSQIEGAEEELFIANRRLIVRCVKPFFWIGQVWLSDFLQEGSKALANAIRRYDFTRGTPFYAYAQTSIQNRLRNYFRDRVRAGNIGARPSREMVMLKTLAEDCQKKNGKEPDDEELAELSGLQQVRVHKLRDRIRRMDKMPPPPLSLDAVVGEHDTTLYQFVEDTSAEVALMAAQRSEIWAAIDHLPARSRHIMHLRFLEGRTLEETGNRKSKTTQFANCAKC